MNAICTIQEAYRQPNEHPLQTSSNILSSQNGIEQNRNFLHTIPTYDRPNSAKKQASFVNAVLRSTTNPFAMLNSFDKICGGMVLSM